MGSSSKETLLLQNVHSFMQTVESLREYLDQMSSTCRELVVRLDYSENDQKELVDTQAILSQQQKIDETVTERPPTPIPTQKPRFSTSSSHSTGEWWVKTPPNTKASDSSSQNQQDSKKEVDVKSDATGKKEREWIFPPLVFRRKTNTFSEATRNRLDKIVQVQEGNEEDVNSSIYLATQRRQDENEDINSVYLADICESLICPVSNDRTYLCHKLDNEPKDVDDKEKMPEGNGEYISVNSHHDNWMCRYVKGEHDPVDSVLQTMMNIGDSLMTPSCISVTCSVHDSDDNRRPVEVEEVNDENNWKYRYKIDSSPPTLRNVCSYNMISSEVDHNVASKYADAMSISCGLSSAASSVLSLPSMEEVVLVEHSAQSRKSSWLTICDNKTASQITCDEGDKVKRTSKSVAKQLKRLKFYQLRGRLGVLGMRCDSRKPTKPCSSHRLYCMSCGRQFEIQHFAIPLHRQKSARSGLVRRLVNTWENLNNKCRKHKVTC